MSMRLMEGCLNTTNTLTDTQNVAAITTMMFAQSEQVVINACINDPNLTYYLEKLTQYANDMGGNISSSKRAYYQSKINEFQQDVQLEQTDNQQYEQQWDADTQSAQTASTTVSTDIQQAVSIAQAAVTASGYVSNLLSSAL